MQDKNAMIKTIGKYSYYTDKCLGEGSFGKVFQGFQNQTKQKVAIKKVDFKTIQKDKYLQKAIHEQIKILNKFKHPNIVKLHEVLNSKRSLYIIMDYCKDGDLKKYLRIKKKLSDAQAAQVMKQVVTGYQQLAKEKTIHRDLKPANILIHNNFFKICDFGFSKVIKDPNTALKTCVGSPIYMAPQILQKKDYSAKCDIWSLGIIYYQLLHGVVPWTARSQKDLISKIKNEKIVFSNGNANTVEIIRKMLEVNEQKRASLRDLEQFFNLQSDQLSNISNTQFLSSQQQFTSTTNNYKPPVNINNGSINLSSQNQYAVSQNVSVNKSISVVNTKVLNRNYFQELAFRYFLATQIRVKLSILNRYNFKKNIFERYVILIIASIICNFNRRRSEIQKIHQKDVAAMVIKQFENYKEFQTEFYRYLSQNFVTCQILQQFQFQDIVRNNFTPQVMKRSQKQLFMTSQNILKQLQQETKLINQPNEKQILLQITELILDFIYLNYIQAKTCNADVEGILIGRINKSIDERVREKISKIKQLKLITEFF